MSDDTANPIQYRKLCGRFGLASASELYEADDHVLLVEGAVTQRYRRFYFDRLQSINVRSSYRTLGELLISGIPSILIIIGIAFSTDSEELVVGLIIVLAPFLILFILSLVRWIMKGASQVVTFQTAVQTCRIPPLGYRRKAQPHLDAIAARVEQVQGIYQAPVAAQSQASVAPAMPSDETPPSPPPSL